MTTGSYWSAVQGIAWRGVKNFFGNPQFLLPALLFPLFFFTAFAGGLSAVGDTPRFRYEPGYTAFEFAFVLIQSATFGGIFSGFTMAADYEKGLGGRFMLAVPHRSAIVVGYTGVALVRWLTTITMLTVVALVVGMNVDSRLVDLGGLLTLGLVVNMSAALFSAGIALRFRTIQAGPLMQTPAFLILFMAPVYVPLGLLTTWIHTAATLNPVTAFLESARGFLAGDPVKVGLAYGAATGVFVLMAMFALTGLRKAERAG